MGKTDDLHGVTPGDLMEHLHSETVAWGLTDSRNQTPWDPRACECWALVDAPLRKVTRHGHNPIDAMKALLRAVRQRAATHKEPKP